MHATMLWLDDLLTSLRGNRVTLVIAAFACMLFCVPSLSPIFELGLNEPSRWQVQRLLGCQLLHWSTEHLLWDLGVFVVLGGLCEQRMRKAFYWTLAIGGMCIPLAIMVFQSNVISYRGLSGLDTALFCLLATVSLREGLRERQSLQVLLFSLLLAALVGKVAFEFCSEQTFFVSPGSFIPLPLAHLVGGLLGAGLAVWADVREGCVRL